MRWVQREGSQLRAGTRRQVQQIPRLRGSRRTPEISDRNPAGDPGELLFYPGVPACLRQCDRAADCSEKMAGRVPDLRHSWLSLSMGRHRAEGNGGGGEMTA